MSTQPLVSILMSVHDGTDWLRPVLDSVKKQTYTNIEVVVLDNASTDNTWNIVSNNYPQFRPIHGKENIGFWAGFEKILSESTGKYVIALTDVVLDPNFVEKAVDAMEKDDKIGAVQAKIYQLPTGEFSIFNFQFSKAIIDTCGFQISRSRRVTNIGHGEKDIGQFSEQKEVFGVEGAAPVFRRKALEDCKLSVVSCQLSVVPWLVDPRYRVGALGYGDDLDVAWRMRLFGWKHIFVPDVIAWHDRSTTKGISHGLFGYLKRVRIRKQIPIEKRRLDWSNVRFTIIKNDYIINILKDLPYIVAREAAVFVYTLLFEPKVFAETVRFFKLLPDILRTRKQIIKKAKVNAQAMHLWSKDLL